MLLRLWSDRPYRATRDLDLLRRGDGAFDTIREDLRAIVTTPVPPDAVTFDGERVGVEAIRAEDEYAGTRATLPARCGKARLKLQIDMGLGDAVWPAPQICTYPTLLNFPPPDLLAYPREAVVAEKLEAMVVLGDRNSRIKDFFDLHYLAHRFESIARRCPRPRSGRSSAATRPSPPETPSDSHACTGRIHRGRCRSGPLPAAPVSRCRRSRKRRSRACCMRFFPRYWRICGGERRGKTPGAREGRGDDCDATPLGLSVGSGPAPGVRAGGVLG